MRKNIDFKEKVVRDYRTRIIIDRDNPILAFKASRDRYTKGKWKGYPLLGSNASEDAISWNVFLTLYKRKRVGYLFEDYKLGRIRALALWGLTPDARYWNKQFQFDIGDTIRMYNGIFKGQTTEPDVVILGSNGLCVIECKLGAPNLPLSHLWESPREKPMESINKRLPVYYNEISSFNNFMNEKSIVYYQLIRMSFYVMVLAKKYGVKPHLTILMNENNWKRAISGYKRSPEDIWREFCLAAEGIIPELVLHCMFWQDLIKINEIKKIDSLYRYLRAHLCLRS